MKKIILLFIILSSLIVKGQTGAQIPCATCSNGSVNFGSRNIKTTGSGTFGAIYAGSISYTGTPSFTSGATFSSNIVIGSNTITQTTSTLNGLPVNTPTTNTGILIKADETGNQFPFIITGTATNADAILESSVNSRFILKNTNTSTRWILSNQTGTTGIGLDGFSIGTSVNPNSGFFKMSSTGSTTLTNNALFSSSVGIGALPSSSLSSFKNVFNSATLDIGASSTGSPAIWLNTTPTTNNYALGADGSGNNVVLNGGTAAIIRVGNGSNIYSTNSTTSYNRLPLRIGSTSAPSATLDVTGTMSVSGSSSIGIGQNNYFGSVISSQLESTNNMYADTKLRIGSVTTPTANLDVTGTMSISSTSSLGGDLYMNGGTRAIRGDAALELYSGGGSNLNLRTSSGSAIITEQFAGTVYVTTSTLGTAVTGSLSSTSVIKTGSTTIQSQATTTNVLPSSSGTIANLAEIPVLYNFAPNTSVSPGDNEVRYCGMLMPNYNALPTATSAIGVYVWDNIEVVGYDITVWNNGTVGSAETVTANLVSGSSSTIIALTSAITSTGQAQFNGTVTPTSVSAGTRILIQYVFPNYATNPSNIWFSAVIKARRKQ